MNGAAEEERDFFISYTATDQRWAEWIAWQLEAAGFSVTLQAWDFRPGQNFVLEMRRALDRSERTIAVVSAAYLASAYATDELTAAFVHEQPGALRLLAIRVEPVEFPRLLRPWIYVDLVDLDPETARIVLLEGLSQQRQKPTREPSFPIASRQAKADIGQARPRFPGRIRRISNLPARNLNFTGRQELLEMLRHNLTKTASTAIIGQSRSDAVLLAEPTPPQALHGLAGIGKSQLALEYAHRHAADYDLCWWIPAEQPATILSSLAVLARELGLSDRADQEELISELRAVLRWRNRWLLIFDNAENPHDVRPYLPRGTGHVLITSQIPTWGEMATRSDIDVLSLDEAIAFLLRRTGSGDQPATRALTQELGGLPLALEQAAAYIEQTGLSIAEYLLLYRQRRELPDKGEPITYGATVDTTLRLTFARVAQRSLAAVQLLQLCAFFAPEVIPHALLRSADPTLLPAQLGSIVQDQAAYVDTVAVLYGYSLVTRDHEGIRLHKLVQRVARQALAPEIRAEWAARAVSLLSSTWPDHAEDPTTWSHCGQLLPHALAAAIHAKAFGAPAESTATLHNRIGVYLSARSRTVIGGAEVADLQSTLDEILAEVARLLGYDVLYFAAPDGNGRLRILSAIGLPHDVVQHQPLIGEAGIAGQVFAAERPLRTSIITDPRGANQGGHLGNTSELAIPIQFKGKMLGVLTAGSSRPEAFTDDDVERLSQITHLVAPLLNSVRSADGGQHIAKLQLLDQTRDDFVAMTTHELRTPLTVIRGFTATLLRPGAALESDEQRHFVQVIDRQTARLARLVEDLLLVSRMQAGMLEVSLAVHDPVDLLTDYNEEWPKEPAPVFLETGRDLPNVRTDPDRFAQVMRNLVDNAQRYGGGSPIRVSARRAMRELVVEVKDQGPGIDSAELPYVFERFRQAGSSSAHRAGMGLGLYITKQLVTALGGSIEVESSQGRGTTFRVRLPGERARSLPSLRT